MAMDWKDSHATVKIVCTSCGYEHEIPVECGDRTCFQCGAVRKSRIVKRLRKVFQDMKNLHLITLTLKRRALTRGNITKLRKDFTKLRHRSIWKGVSGGFYNIELGQLTSDGFCNLHLHGMYDGSDIPQKELSKVWKEITGGSYVVWIERCKGRDSAARYMAKHFCKIVKNPSESNKNLINIVLNNTRLVQGFGRLRALPKPGPSECPQCHALSPFISCHNPLYYVVLDAFDGLEYDPKPA